MFIKNPLKIMPAKDNNFIREANNNEYQKDSKIV